MIQNTLLEEIRFNAHHSPVGAHASFTLGFPGKSGGFGLELGGPACHNVYIGAEVLGKVGAYEALPFFEEVEDDMNRYVLGEQGDEQRWAALKSIDLKSVQRRYTQNCDEWSTKDFRFTIYSPTWSVPDPESPSCNLEILKETTAPLVYAELEIDNRASSVSRRGFFGFAPLEGADHFREVWSMEPNGIQAIACGQSYGIATADPGVSSAGSFTIERLLGDPEVGMSHHSIGGCGTLEFCVPAGEKKVVRFAIGFFRSGIVTTGIEARYWYNRYFDSLESVLNYGVEHFEAAKAGALQLDAENDCSKLNPAQEFQWNHAVHSYYGSTQFLEHDGRPFWVVNEGEYRMLNTLDLTADQLFFELKRNAWTVRNELDRFLEFYSYEDEVFFPGKPEERFPGGLSFTHDMGVSNCFSKPGHSYYETAGLKGCFSYMTCEELVNWIACAASYCETSGDREWRCKNIDTFVRCFESLRRRDHPEDSKRNGVMGLDSTRTAGGSEITTYDSLDESLGQSRGNTYLAVKSWAVYLALERIFEAEGLASEAAEARTQAERGMKTVMASVDSDGRVPALLGRNKGSVIIPIVEGLVFLPFSGRDDVFANGSPYQEFLDVLRRHSEAVLQKDICLFDDGGWKLSSTTINSWLSKIYLCQYVCRTLLGVNDVDAMARADEAHMAWLLRKENAFFAWGDQFYAGDLRGSKYYPRGVSSVLWLK